MAAPALPGNCRGVNIFSSVALRIGLLRITAAVPRRRCPSWVKTRRTQREQISAAVPPLSGPQPDVSALRRCPIRRHSQCWREMHGSGKLHFRPGCDRVTDQEKKPKVVMVEAAQSERSCPPILTGHAYLSDFQSTLHQEATSLLQRRGIQPSSTYRWSGWLSSNYVSVTFEDYEIEIFGDRANLLLRPGLDKHFEVGGFDDFDQLKHAVLRLLEALLDYNRFSFEEVIRTAIERRTGWSVKFFNRHPGPGLFSFERLSDVHAQSIDWQEVANELARETDVAVLFIGHGWTGPPDNLDVTFIVFHLPHLTEAYVEDNRNIIQPVSPSGSRF